MGAVDFASSLVPVRGQELSRGDTVYELIQWGTRAGDVKLSKLRVIRTVRAAAQCECCDGAREGQHVTIPFHRLRMEPKPEAAPSDTGTHRVRLVKSAPVSEPPPSPVPRPAASSGQDFDALVEMGRDVLGNLAREQAALEKEQAKLVRDVEAIDANHRKTIEALEQELIEARRAHEDDRRFAATRAETIDKRLAQITRRRQLLEALAEPVL